MKIFTDFTKTGIPISEIESLRGKAEGAFSALWDNFNGAFTGAAWLNYPNQVSKDDIKELKDIAAKIRNESDALLVIGTGGSYWGAKSVTELIPGDSGAKLIFLGYDLSARRLEEVLGLLENLDFSVCVISKSGKTMEPLVAFNIIEEYMMEKYGREAAADRTYIITEEGEGDNRIREYAEDNNCNIICIPSDICGRYSVFTAVGLLPLAVYGIDVEEFIEGARELSTREAFAGGGLDYAICRNIFSRSKSIEIFESFNPYAESLTKWIQQLFGESEGKDGKGMFPAVLSFGRDLHSIGQFLQEGNPIFFETMIFSEKTEWDCSIPKNEMLFSVPDMNLATLESYVRRSVVEAHRKSGIPLGIIGIEEVSPKNIGRLLYYFMVQSAVSAVMIGVDPFNQPGVEAYKSEMRKLLGKMSESNEV